MKVLSDTSPECEQVLIGVYRRMPIGEKWLMLGRLFEEAKILHAAGVRFRNPRATLQEIHSKWLELHFGPGLLSANRRNTLNPATQDLKVLREVVGALNSLNVAYA